MKKLIILAFVLVLVGFLVYQGLNYFALIQSNTPSTLSDDLYLNGNPKNTESVEFTVQEVVSDLFVPWSIVFTSQDRVLVAERNGNIRAVVNQTLVEEPLYTFSDVAFGDEEGLMGLEKDPNYQNNNYLYACYAYQENGQLFDRVVRLVDLGGTIEVDTVLLEQIPAARFHAGCRVKFGPDNKLYVTTGDATQKDLAQDLNSLAGKILRMNSDGTIPQDNPFENSYVYSYGHRNAQGITWNPETGQMFSTEHGPSIFDGPAGGDEVNFIEAGKNYGWPVVSHEDSAEGMEDPELVFTPAVAPASAMFYTGELLPQFKNTLFFGGLRGEGLFNVIVNENSAVGFTKLPQVEFGRIREVAQSPNGEIWFSTSNTDGRGNLNSGDDKIYKIVPKN